MNKEKEKIFVIGAGASGLSSAWSALLSSDSLDIRIIEKSSRVGGLCSYIDWNNHKIDIGPHRLSPNLEEVKRVAEHLLGPKLTVQKSQHGVIINGKIFQFPPRIIDWLNLFGFYFLSRCFFSFIFTKFIWIINRFKRDSFESIMKYTFGSFFYSKIIYPMAEKVWCNPKQIDHSFAELRFGHITPNRVFIESIKKIRKFNPDVFLYPKGGFHKLFESMATEIQQLGGVVSTDSSLYKVNIQNNLIHSLIIKEKNGSQTSYKVKSVMSSIPVNELIKTFEWSDEKLNDLKKLCAQLNFRSMILVAIEHTEYKNLPYRVIIAPEQDYIFNRVFDQGLYDESTVSKKKSIYVADITCEFMSGLYSESDESIISKVIQDLEKLNLYDQKKFSAAKVVRIPYSYVVPDEVSRKAMYEIRHILKDIKNLKLTGRFSIGEYDNSDYAIQNGLTMGRLLTGKITELDYVLNSKGSFHFHDHNHIVG